LRIVISEDGTLFREGLARLLEDAGHEVVAKTVDAPSLIAAVDTTLADLAIVDIRMPPDNTDDRARAARILRANHPELGIVLLSQHMETNHSVELVSNKTGDRRTLKTPALFSFIGAAPRTEWLPPEIEKDAKNFIRTGTAVAQSPRWTSKRQPFLLETSRAGVFAAGDVRSGSIKRVASAVGEGAMAVMFVHEYLKDS